MLAQATSPLALVRSRCTAPVCSSAASSLHMTAWQRASFTFRASRSLSGFPWHLQSNWHPAEVSEQPGLTTCSTTAAWCLTAIPVSLHRQISTKRSEHTQPSPRRPYAAIMAATTPAAADVMLAAPGAAVAALSTASPSATPASAAAAGILAPTVAATAAGTTLLQPP